MSESFKVAPDAWHYKLLMKKNLRYTRNKDYIRSSLMPRDFCSYWSEVINELLRITTIIAMIGGLGVLYVYSLFTFPVVREVTLTILFAVIAILTWIFMIYPIISFIGRLLVDHWVDPVLKQRNEIKEKKKPGLISMKIKTIKDKYCPVIEYEE